jgi:hypothetical protein
MNPKKPNRRPAKKGDSKPSREKKQDTPSIKDLLLNGPRFDLIIPERTRWRRRSPVIFD